MSLRAVHFCVRQEPTLETLEGVPLPATYWVTMKASSFVILVLAYLFPDHLNLFIFPLSFYNIHSFILNSTHLSTCDTLGMVLGAGNEGEQDRSFRPLIIELTELSSFLEKTII